VYNCRHLRRVDNDIAVFFFHYCVVFADERDDGFSHIGEGKTTNTPQIKTIDLTNGCAEDWWTVCGRSFSFHCCYWGKFGFDADQKEVV
jgi:hypothetical protein